MKFISIIIFLLFASASSANSYVQSSRYAEIDISAKQEQIDPLSVVINFSFPRETSTVGDALYLITAPSGYRFKLDELDIAYILFEMPLPEVHKQLGPMTLRNAISILAGKGFTPQVDEATRLISFTSSSESIKNLQVRLFKESWLSKRTKTIKANTSIVSEPRDRTEQLDVSNQESKRAEQASRIDTNNHKSYLVQKGDSVSKIAARLGIDYSELFSFELVNENPHAFIQDDPNKLLAGKIIQVPSL
ncbi:LysM peptidoglycan-binding domain-containing protein [Aliikangiella maris]|uniref:LysM peptidoglycan-binding domain-containing protein n=2 Tax=Aliikangiella maris TaxID=3162458 RepID=A0ABV2BYC3_9GAMM